MGGRVITPSSAKGQRPEANQAGTRPSTLAPAQPWTMAWIWWPADHGHPRSHPLLCGSRALGQCPSILLGMLPGFKHLSILKEGDGMERPTQPWPSAGQIPYLPFCLDPGQSHQPGGTAARVHTLCHAKESAVQEAARMGGKTHQGLFVFFLTVVKYT